MPEVRDFDSMRISLASPEQIRSWSFGELPQLGVNLSGFEGEDVLRA